MFIKLGMEDEEIHCLKESEGVADARESIQRGTVMLATAMDTEFKESDPFAELKMTKMSACFDIAVESRHLFMCYLNFSCSLYSRVARTSFITSRGVATIQSRAVRHRANMVFVASILAKKF